MAGGKEQASVGNTGPQRGSWNSRDNHSSHPRRLSLCSETDKMHNWTSKNKVPALCNPKNSSRDPDELTREIQTEGWRGAFSRLSSDSDKDLGTWIVSFQEKESAQVWDCTQRTASSRAVLGTTKARALGSFQKINHASHSEVGAHSQPSFPTV